MERKMTDPLIDYIHRLEAETERLTKRLADLRARLDAAEQERDLLKRQRQRLSDENADLVQALATLTEDR